MITFNFFYHYIELTSSLFKLYSDNTKSSPFNTAASIVGSGKLFISNSFKISFISLIKPE